VKQIDYMVASHYHSDHMGGIPYLAQNIRIVNYVDHGQNVEYGKSDEWWKERRAPMFHPGIAKKYDETYDSYAKARATGHHIVVNAGDTIPFQGIEVRAVTSAGKTLNKPLQGAGNPNPACAHVDLRAVDDAEDAQSVGLLISYGKFRFIDLGDLTWNVSYRLFCPDNKVGMVDAYLITHHADSLKQSLGPYFWGLSCCSKAEVYGLHPEVAILSLGPKSLVLSLGSKSLGDLGSGDGLQTVRSSPGLEDVWQTNYLIAGREKEYTAPEKYCANIGTTDGTSEFIKLVSQSTGSFAVINSRTGFSKEYPPRK
jgi:competence protein ComEC